MLEKILEEIESVFEENVEDIEDENGTHHFVINSFTAKFLARDIIRKHMNDGWIPCDERMPEEGEGDLLVTDSSGRIWSDMCYGFVRRRGKICFHRRNDEMWSYFNPGVIAWRPPLEPYRPEKGAIQCQVEEN